MPSIEPPVPCLVGPTGSGKTDAGIALARLLGAEVVCCDAMTVYRGLSVLTAKPVPPPDVPHHLVDLVEVDDEGGYSAARFADDADRAIEDIRSRGRTPLIVGGTALYLHTWRKGLGPRVGRDPRLRADLEAVARSEGAGALHARLAAVDPARAAALHRNDERRLVRALEIVAATGKPASLLRGQWEGPDRRAAAVVGLRRSPEDLARRIEARVAAMAAAGVVDEVRSLLASGRKPSMEVAQALGLSDLVAHVEGRLPLADALARIAAATRRFARKQMTFFRRFGDAGVSWVDVPPDATPEAVADLCSRALRA